MYGCICFEGAVWGRVRVQRGDRLVEAGTWDLVMGDFLWGYTQSTEMRWEMAIQKKGKQGWRTQVCGVIMSKGWRMECCLEKWLGKEKDIGCVNFRVEFCIGVSGHIAQVLERIPLQESLLESIFLGQFLSSSRDRLLRGRVAMCFFLEMAFWRWQEVTFKAVPHRKLPALLCSSWMQSPWLGASGEPSRWQHCWFLQLQTASFHFVSRSQRSREWEQLSTCRDSNDIWAIKPLYKE